MLRLIAALIGTPAFFESSDYNPDFPGVFVFAFEIKKFHGHVIADGAIKRECLFASSVKTERQPHKGISACSILAYYRPNDASEITFIPSLRV